MHQVLKGQVINKVTRLEDAIYATINAEKLLPATLNVTRNNITFWNIFLSCHIGKKKFDDSASPVLKSKSNDISSFRMKMGH